MVSQRVRCKEHNHRASDLLSSVSLMEVTKLYLFCIFPNIIYVEFLVFSKSNAGMEIWGLISLSSNFNWSSI